jgi:hypothetical protein
VTLRVSNHGAGNPGAKALIRVGVANLLPAASLAPPELRAYDEFADRCRHFRRASNLMEANMSDLDKVISEAVAKQDVPFLVAMTGNAGGVTWSGTAGERSPGQVPRRYGLSHLR